MPYVSPMEIYADGREKGYGVPMINVVNYEMIQWAIDAAEDMGMPILIGFHPDFSWNMDPECMATVTKLLAARAKVPVALHLDHSPSLDVIAKYLKWFDSVMIDGSSLPYEENVAITAETAHFCHKMGVCVEAELGHVGDATSLDDIQNADHYTQVDQCVDFIARTGCDSLAIAIGNAHGSYVASPNLDFERLQAIRKAVDIPLVLHGGSGIPSDQFTRCVTEGMSKFNVFTDYDNCFSGAVKRVLDEKDIGMFRTLLAVAEPCRELVRQKIALLNPKGLRVI